MLLNLHKKSWMDGLALQDFDTHCSTNETTVKVRVMEEMSAGSICNGTHRVILGDAK
jgi:molybdopterin biosynthesis enzyme